MGEPKKSKQTVSENGELIIDLIEGIKIHYPPTLQDDRGTLCEIYGHSWNFDDLPIPHAYLVTIRPGKVKGWAVHSMQTDRYFFVSGTTKLVLYDDRKDSCSHKKINELYFSEHNRALVSVPPGVYHAVEAVGISDSLLFNIPSHPYNHTDPDKHTLPLVNTIIPYQFEPIRGY